MSAGDGSALVTYEGLREDPEVREMLAAADREMAPSATPSTDAPCYHRRTECGMILTELRRYSEREVELARIAGCCTTLATSSPAMSTP